jgi:hypothetical protein
VVSAAIVISLGLWLLGAGLWLHDWRLILAGAVTAVVWPLVAPDVSRVAELDRLWADDDDLSESA